MSVLDGLRFNSLLVFEQLLGRQMFSLLMGKSKRRFLLKLEQRFLRNEPNTIDSVERHQDLSASDFYNRYFKQSQPVVFEQIAKNWPCCQKWTLDHFSVHHGDNNLLLVDAQGLTRRDERKNFEFLTLRDLVTNIKNGGEKYLRFSPLVKENPALAEDLDLGWLETMKGGTSFGNTYYMFIGGKGQKTFLHNDQPCNLFVQVSGEKKWTLYKPRDLLFLYPELTNSPYIKTPLDVSNPDFEKFPLFKNASAYEVILKPGDVLYVPPFWWHQVENVSDSIAVGYRFSSLVAALRSSVTFTLIRLLSTNPPIWKTMEYGQKDTNLIWAHSNGQIKEVLEQWERRHDLRLSQ